VASRILRLRRDDPAAGPARGRVGRMAAAWALVGVILGFLTRAEPHAPASGIAGAIAGMLVMAPLGALLGRFGGRPAEALLGAALGTLVGMVAGFAQGHGLVALGAERGLIIGTVAGTTVRPYSRLACLRLGLTLRIAGLVIVRLPGVGPWLVEATGGRWAGRLDLPVFAPRRGLRPSMRNTQPSRA
jgi:hypothetical protein